MKHKNKNIKYNGGTTTDLNFEKAFYTFLYHSKISFFANGGSGLIFKCDLNDSFKNNSPYYSFSCNNYGQKVTSLIIKVIFINESVNKKNKNDFSFQLNNSNIFQESPQSFLNELYIQSDICLKTIRYLEPITPIIVYSDILSNQNSNNFINILRNNFNGDVRILDYIESLISNYFINKSVSTQNMGPFDNYPSYPTLSMLGIIGMEMLGTNYLCIIIITKIYLHIILLTLNWKIIIKIQLKIIKYLMNTVCIKKKLKMKKLKKILKN